MKTRKELLVELVAGLLMSPKQGTIRQHVEEAQELLTEIERACPEDEARSLEGHAAPDLLEALKGLVEAADQDWPHAPKCDPAESPCCCEVIEIGRATQKARAAIAKAEGES